MSGRHVTPRARLLEHRKVTPGWLVVHVATVVALAVFVAAFVLTIGTLIGTLL
jgi:hypothetical protein